MNKSIAKEYNFRWEKKRRTQRLKQKCELVIYLPHMVKNVVDAHLLVCFKSICYTTYWFIWVPGFLQFISNISSYSWCCRCGFFCFFFSFKHSFIQHMHQITRYFIICRVFHTSKLSAISVEKCILQHMHEHQHMLSHTMNNNKKGEIILAKSN